MRNWYTKQSLFRENLDSPGGFSQCEKFSWKLAHNRVLAAIENNCPEFPLSRSNKKFPARTTRRGHARVR